MIYAKSNPEETLKEHTDALINQYYKLKKIYSKEINQVVKMDRERFWELLKIACEYHDFGKANITFQNIIRKAIGIEELQDDIKINIPHNYISPAFIPLTGLNKNERRLLIHSVGYHHERDADPDSEIIQKIVDNDLSKHLDEISKHMNVEIDKISTKYTKNLKDRINETEELYLDYIIMKGLLHRIDHAASAHEGIEDDDSEGVGKLTKQYIETEFSGGLRDAQKFAYANKENNVLLVASTGIGKTESALLWIDNSKAFFTLPLRVSINALYSRVKDEIKYEYTGLIHSTSRDYLDGAGYNNSSEIYEQSRLLAKKLSFSTIDQLFKYPFKYKGYEKIYATLAYSKIVIDEIQAYSPEITAVILKGLEMLNKIGGKFMVMTATLPRIYKEYLKKKGIELAEGQYLSPIRRHKIKIEDKEIIEIIDKIIERGKSNKVIVIVNTVKRALELYEEIKDKKEFNNCYLLHSMFIQEDRAKLEKEIKKFADNNKNKGIWITTQIVEASLDVDFDYLFTEISTLDSAFQRFGRCYRKRPFDKEEANIYIYTKNPTGYGTIYDESILDKSIEFIKEFDNKLMNEKDKVDLVDKLYSEEELKETEFYKKFIKALNILDNVIDYDLTSTDAQKVLRDIDSVRVIPKEIYDENMGLFDKYFKSEAKDKFNLLSAINKLTVNVPKYKCEKYINPIDKIKNMYILYRAYDSHKGVLLDKEDNNLF